jgi:hypothetical protein
MEELINIQDLFSSVLGVEVELDGEVLSEAELEKKNFILFVESYREAILRSTKLHEEYGIDIWAYEDLYAKSLEGLINLAFPADVCELILWYVYEHPLAENDTDKIVSDTEGNEYMIETAEELYNLIITLEEE